MRILLALDFSSLTSALVAQVQGLAGDSAGSGHTVEVFVLHVAAPDPDFVGYEAGPQSVRDQRANELREEHRELEALAERLSEHPRITAHPRLIQGPTAETLCAQAEEHQTDWIVMGSRGIGAVQELFLGSTSKEVLQNSPCPVLIVPAHLASE